MMMRTISPQIRTRLVSRLEYGKDWYSSKSPEGDTRVRVQKISRIKLQKLKEQIPSDKEVEIVKKVKARKLREKAENIDQLDNTRE